MFNQRLISSVLLGILFFSSISVNATQISGKVIKVLDGDTVHILLSDNSRKTIRLAGIDAPEKKQAFGKKAKRYLSQFIGHEDVDVDYNKIDKYGRLIGVIKIGLFDVNLAMIRGGLAWHYKKYQHEQPLRKQLAYAGTEKQAKKRKLGLWRDNKAIAPWVFRERKRKSKQLNN